MEAVARDAVHHAAIVNVQSDVLLLFVGVVIGVFVGWRLNRIVVGRLQHDERSALASSAGTERSPSIQVSRRSSPRSPTVATAAQRGLAAALLLGRVTLAFFYLQTLRATLGLIASLECPGSLAACPSPSSTPNQCATPQQCWLPNSPSTAATSSPWSVPLSVLGACIPLVAQMLAIVPLLLTPFTPQSASSRLQLCAHAACLIGTALRALSGWPAVSGAIHLKWELLWQSTSLLLLQVPASTYLLALSTQCLVIALLHIRQLPPATPWHTSVCSFLAIFFASIPLHTALNCRLHARPRPIRRTHSRSTSPGQGQGPGPAASHQLPSPLASTLSSTEGLQSHHPHGTSSDSPQNTAAGHDMQQTHPKRLAPLRLRSANREAAGQSHGHQGPVARLRVNRSSQRPARRTVSPTTWLVCVAVICCVWGCLGVLSTNAAMSAIAGGRGVWEAAPGVVVAPVFALSFLLAAAVKHQKMPWWRRHRRSTARVLLHTCAFLATTTALVLEPFERHQHHFIKGLIFLCSNTFMLEDNLRSFLLVTSISAATHKSLHLLCTSSLSLPHLLSLSCHPEYLLVPAFFLLIFRWGKLATVPRRPRRPSRRSPNSVQGTHRRHRDPWSSGDSGNSSSTGSIRSRGAAGNLGTSKSTLRISSGDDGDHHTQGPGSFSPPQQQQQEHEGAAGDVEKDGGQERSNPALLATQKAQAAYAYCGDVFESILQRKQQERFDMLALVLVYGSAAFRYCSIPDPLPVLLPRVLDLSPFLAFILLVSFQWPIFQRHRVQLLVALLTVVPLGLRWVQAVQGVANPISMLGMVATCNGVLALLGISTAMFARLLPHQLLLYFVVICSNQSCDALGLHPLLMLVESCWTMVACFSVTLALVHCSKCMLRGLSHQHLPRAFSNWLCETAGNRDNAVVLLGLLAWQQYYLRYVSDSSWSAGHGWLSVKSGEIVVHWLHQNVLSMLPFERGVQAFLSGLLLAVSVCVLSAVLVLVCLARLIGSPRQWYERQHKELCGLMMQPLQGNEPLPVLLATRLKSFLEAVFKGCHVYVVQETDQAHAESAWACHLVRQASGDGIPPLPNAFLHKSQAPSIDAAITKGRLLYTNSLPHLLDLCQSQHRKEGPKQRQTDHQGRSHRQPSAAVVSASSGSHEEGVQPGQHSKRQAAGAAQAARRSAADQHQHQRQQGVPCVTLPAVNSPFEGRVFADWLMGYASGIKSVLVAPISMLGMSSGALVVMSPLLDRLDYHTRTLCLDLGTYLAQVLYIRQVQEQQMLEDLLMSDIMPKKVADRVKQNLARQNSSDDSPHRSLVRHSSDSSIFRRSVSRESSKSLPPFLPGVEKERGSKEEKPEGLLNDRSKGADQVQGTGAHGPGDNALAQAPTEDVVYKQWHENMSVLFVDVVGFTAMAQELEPEQVMMLLHKLFCKYDALSDEMGVYKVETIGDCYMACVGLLDDDPQHAERLVAFGMALLQAAGTVSDPRTGQGLCVRVGVHSGRVMSGVVGSARARYCLFGDTVNTASRMESTAPPGCIQISESTYALLPPASRDKWKPRQHVEVKGKGLMNTYLHAAVADEAHTTTSPAAPTAKDITRSSSPFASNLLLPVSSSFLEDTTDQVDLPDCWAEEHSSATEQPAAVAEASSEGVVHAPSESGVAGW